MNHLPFIKSWLEKFMNSGNPLESMEPELTAYYAQHAESEAISQLQREILALKSQIELLRSMSNENSKLRDDIRRLHRKATHVLEWKLNSRSQLEKLLDELKHYAE